MSWLMDFQPGADDYLSDRGQIFEYTMHMSIHRWCHLIQVQTLWCSGIFKDCTSFLICVSEGSHKLSSMCLIKLADKTLPRKCGEKWLTARIGHLLAPLYPSKPQSFQFMASLGISWFSNQWCTRYTHCTCRPCTYPLKHKIIFKYVLVNYSKEDSACTTWNSLINFLLSFLFDLMKNLNTLSLGCGDHGFHRKSTSVRLTKCQCRMCILLF